MAITKASLISYPDSQAQLAPREILALSKGLIEETHVMHQAKKSQ